MSSASRISQLENTVLELGTEMYKLRHQVAGLSDFQERFVGIMKGLKQILDEKGLITTDDFDAAVELGEAINIEASTSFDPSIDSAANLFKKSSH